MRYDNGGEYISSEFMQIFSDNGINIQHSIPYTPQQNGVVERKNCSLKEMTTCMLEAKGLDENLWVEAMNVTTHIHNRVTHFSMKVNKPLESYFGQKTNVSNFKVFWSTAWAHFPHDKTKDLKPQSVECLFIGYPE